MDNELSTGAMIAIELVVLSAVIGIVMIFAGIGQGFQRTAMESINNIIASTYGAELEGLSDTSDLPTASVYVILEKNIDIIDSVSGTIIKTYADGSTNYYRISKIEDLLNYFDTRIETTVTKKKNDRYDIEVESPEYR